MFGSKAVSRQSYVMSTDGVTLNELNSEIDAKKKIKSLFFIT